MRNLKKVLSLVLCMAMMLSVMVMGTGAAFTDQEEIVNTEAVDMNVALNIIGGYPDGTYKPEGNITRAEACKMICVALNGGKEPVLGTNATPTFADIDGNWAEAYIEYCVSEGIVAGVGDGKFDPNGLVTGTQFAKMLLIALGYNANHEKFIGEAWAVNVNVKASQKNLYEDLASMDPSVELSRDNAAQMVWNALQANEVEYQSTLVTNANGEITTQVVVQDKMVERNGNDETITLLEDKYDADLDEGILVSVVYNDVKDYYTYRLEGSSTNYRSTDDYSDLMGQCVTIVEWTEKKSNQVDYGMFVSEGSVLAESYVSEIDTASKMNQKEITIDDVDYDMDGTAINVQVFNSPATSESTVAAILAQSTAVAEIKLIDTNGDNDADRILVLPFTVGTISYVGNDAFSFKGYGNTGTLVSVEKEDVVLYDDAAKDDVVIKVASANLAGSKDVYTQGEYVSGTITGVKGAKYMIDDVWYTNVSATNLEVGDTIDYVAFGSVIYLAEVTSGAVGTDNLAMIYRVGDVTANGTTGVSVEIRLITADGEKITGTLAKINEVAVTDATTVVAGTKDITDQAASASPDKLVGAIVYYELNSDDEYEVKTIPASYNTAEVLGFDGTGAAGDDYATATEFFGSYELADDAIVFVLKGTVGAANTTNDAKVYTGKEIKNTGANQNNTVATFASSLYDSANGFTYTQVATIQDSTNWPNIVQGANYGYLTSDAYHTKEGSDTYTNYVMWTADGSITVKEEKNQTLSNFVAGTLVTFDNDGEGIVKNVTLAGASVSYITGYDADAGKVQINGATSTEIADDTVILYVDSKNTEGVTERTLAIADKPDGTNYVNNVCYVDGVGKDFALIVMDVNNNFVNVPAIALTAPNATQLATALASSDEVSISGDLPANAVIPEGKTVIVSGNVNSPVTGEGALDVAGTINAAANVSKSANGVANAEVSLPENVSLSGTGTITGFSSDSIDTLAGLTDGSTVSIYDIVLSATQAPGGAVVSMQEMVSGSWQNLAAGPFAGGLTITIPAGDTTGLTHTHAFSDTVQALKVTVTIAGTPTDYTFTK